MRSYTELLGRVYTLQLSLDSSKDTIGVKIVLDVFDDGEPYITLRYHNKTASGLINFIGDKAKIMEEARLLKSPKFEPLTAPYIEVIGKQVWIDQNIPTFVKSVTISGHSTIITTMDNTSYEADRLWRRV